MSLLGTLLPGILSSINPGNILRGVVNTGVGILKNISEGKPVDISGNLARGLKTVIGEEQSALGSIGGNHMLEPEVEAKINGSQNAANIFNMQRMKSIGNDLKKSIDRNAANHIGVWSEDRTKNMSIGKYPANEMLPLNQAIESAPAGMPDRRVSLVHSNMKQVPARDLLNSRDQYGYKSTPVVMQGVNGGGSFGDKPAVKVAKFKVAKKIRGRRRR